MTAWQRAMLRKVVSSVGDLRRSMEGWHSLYVVAVNGVYAI